MTTDLVTWLREQIAEDRQIAEQAAQPWPDEPPELSWGDTRVASLEDAGWETYAVKRIDRHVVRWDPETVLALGDAHTAILDEHEPKPWPAHLGKGIDCACGQPVARRSGCRTVRAVALAYQHRPGYLEVWRP